MFTNSARIKDEEELLLCPENVLTATTDHDCCSLQARSVTERIYDCFGNVWSFIIPSFWQRKSIRLSPISTEKSLQFTSYQKQSTRYFDGVRGVASFIVFVFHFTHMMYPGTNKGFGVDGQVSIWQLPIVRLVYSGAAMVPIFFVVSGYVLSHRFIQMMRMGEYERFYAGLASLAFRRAIRLFVPVIASVVLQFLVALGFPSILPRRINGKTFYPGTDTLLQNIDKLTTPWNWDPYMDAGYNPQLWSVALEFRGSMVVFVMLLALSKTRLWMRATVQMAMVVHAFSHKRWDVALFIAGVLLAELDVHVSSFPTKAAFIRKKGMKLCLVLSLLLGVWLSGFPRDKGIQSYGYGFLRSSWPYSDYRRRFWLAIAGILIVAPMPYLPSVQQFFNSNITTYLGNISFSLYLIHGLGNRTAAAWLLHLTHSYMGQKGYWTDTACFAVTAVLYIPLVIWWADMFWRAIDRPSTTFAKWIEQKTRLPG